MGRVGSSVDRHRRGLRILTTPGISFGVGIGYGKGFRGQRCVALAILERWIQPLHDAGRPAWPSRACLTLALGRIFCVLPAVVGRVVIYRWLSSKAFWTLASCSA